MVAGIINRHVYFRLLPCGLTVPPGTGKGQVSRDSRLEAEQFQVGRSPLIMRAAPGLDLSSDVQRLLVDDHGILGNGE